MNIEALDHTRTAILSNNNRTVSDDEVFYIISNSKIEELLEKGGEKTLFVEKRNEILTLTNGSYVLEKVSPCPPDCCPPIC